MSYAKTLDALAHGLRREILSLLGEKPRSVGELAEALPVSQPAVSQHLRVLREAGLVGMEEDGTRHVYHLDRRGLDELKAYLDEFWEGPLRSYKESFRSGGRAGSPSGRRKGKGRPSPEGGKNKKRR